MDECTKEELEEVQRQLAETCNDPNFTIVGGPHLTFEDFERIIQCLVLDQRVEITNAGFFRAVNFNYPSALANIDRDNKTGSNQANSRILFTEIPCAHC